MKTTRPIAILLALSAIAALTADASAYYHPTVGRFITRDPGPGRNSSPPAATAHFPPRDPTETNQYADGMNLYEYVRSAPVGYVDPRGTNLYAVGGTREIFAHNANVAKFWKLYVGTKHYWSGSGTRGVHANREGKIDTWLNKKVNSVAGRDSRHIVDGVVKMICEDYCKDTKIKIHLVGWSRGAAQVIEVTDELKEKGCCCDGKKVKGPQIRWMGLFDVVHRIADTGFSTNVHGNVTKAYHLKKTDHDGFKQGTVFKTTKLRTAKGVLTEKEVYADDFYPRDPGAPREKTAHGDIGTEDYALWEMIANAIDNGLVFDKKGSLDLLERLGLQASGQQSKLDLLPGKLDSGPARLSPPIPLPTNP